MKNEYAGLSIIALSAKEKKAQRDDEIWKAFINNIGMEHPYATLAKRFGISWGTTIRTSLLRSATAERVKALGVTDALRVLKILARRGCVRKEKTT